MLVCAIYIRRNERERTLLLFYGVLFLILFGLSADLPASKSSIYRYAAVSVAFALHRPFQKLTTLRLFFIQRDILLYPEVITSFGKFLSAYVLLRVN